MTNAQDSLGPKLDLQATKRLTTQMITKLFCITLGLEIIILRYEYMPMTSCIIQLGKDGDYIQFGGLMLRHDLLVMWQSCLQNYHQLVSLNQC